MDSVQYRVHRMRFAYNAHKFRCSLGRSCLAGILWREHRKKEKKGLASHVEGMCLNCEEKKRLIESRFYQKWHVQFYLFCSYLMPNGNDRANQISVGCCLILSYYKVNLSQKTTTIVCVFVYCCFHVIFLFLFCCCCFSLSLFVGCLLLLFVCFAKYT